MVGGLARNSISDERLEVGDFLVLARKVEGSKFETMHPSSGGHRSHHAGTRSGVNRSNARF